MDKQKTVVVCGCTGYIGRYVTLRFQAEGYRVKALTRSKASLEKEGFCSPVIIDAADEVIVADVTKPDTLKGVFAGADVVFSSVGISRQRDGKSFRDIDYQANVNILREVQSAQGAEGATPLIKFLYISLFGEDDPLLKDLEIVRAHEDFVAELHKSNLPHTVIRPTGYYSDMGVIMEMAHGGRVWIVGDGNNKMNPIHGADLAAAVVSTVDMECTEYCVGGPDVLTQNEAADLAYEVLTAHGLKSSGTKSYLSVSMLKNVSWAISFLSTQFGDLFDFIFTAGEVNGIAPNKVGTVTMRLYFEQELERIEKAKSKSWW